MPIRQTPCRKRMLMETHLMKFVMMLNSILEKHVFTLSQKYKMIQN